MAWAIGVFILGCVIFFLWGYVSGMQDAVNLYVEEEEKHARKDRGKKPPYKFLFNRDTTRDSKSMEDKD